LEISGCDIGSPLRRHLILLLREFGRFEITPTPGKSMDRHVSRSIISSTIRETRTDEDSSTSAVRRGP
jgi:hypothetical protein